MSILNKVLELGGKAATFAKGTNPYIAGGALALGALRKPIGNFLQNQFGVGQQPLDVQQSLLTPDVKRLLEQREGLAQQMIAGVPQQQQQQIYGTAADEAAALNRQAQQGLAMQGMGGGGNYGSMLEQITQNRMRGGAAQQIAALQPQFQQMGANMLGSVQDTYQGIAKTALEQDMMNRANQGSNIRGVLGMAGDFASQVLQERLKQQGMGN
tara:strand:+ start:204 stop:839 length:636 start_codon:yes stop_codon:yes gene_type:complete